MHEFIHRIVVATGPVTLTGLLVGCASGTPAAAETTPKGSLSVEVSELRARASAQAGLIGELEARLALLESEARSGRRDKPRDTVVISSASRRKRREQRAAEPAEPAPVKLVLDGRRQRRERAAQALPPLPSGPVPGLGVVPLPGDRPMTAPVAGSPKQQYRSALSLMRAQDYDGAIAALDSFIQRNPGHALEGNALHWKGEAQYARRDYRAALTSFDAVVQRYPRSAKRSDALLKVGMCHRRLGDEELARTFFQRVRKEFPKSDAARVASGEGAS